jgi:hypothetical protein
MNSSNAALISYCKRGYHESALSLAKVNIEVPSMGDSITEGSVASVQKREGMVDCINCGVMRRMCILFRCGAREKPELGCTVFLRAYRRSRHLSLQVTL